ncbi:MAG: TIR domain-containing protein [Pseudomonadales bacterium]
MDKPFSAYRGTDAYVFVCYAHGDSATVYPQLTWLRDHGVNIWYDEGISPGLEWSEALAHAIQGCARFLYFVSPSSVVSENCRRELNFAQEEGCDVIAVHLEPTEIPPGLRLNLNNRQAVLRHELADDLYFAALLVAARGDTPTAPHSTATAPGKRRAPLVIGAAALLLLIAVIFIFYRSSPSPAVQTPTTVAPSTDVAQAVLAKSIAVLPFENMSPDPERSYFAAGIHGEIINQLSKVRDLAVIARTTMATYANTAKSIPEIGRELRVGSVMEGSVRYAGNRVRITAQLIDADSGTQLWSDAYEADLEDIFGIQLAMASRLSEALEAEFSASEQASIGNAATSDPEAYSQYLLGMSLTGDFATMAPVHEALEKAVALDPEFADALAFNAMMYGFEANYAQFTGESYNAETSLRNAQLGLESAQRALQLDPDQPLALLATGDFEGAYRINPNDYRVLSSLAFRRIWVEGRVEEGIALLARSAEINPADTANLWYFSDHLFGLQRWEHAIRVARDGTRVAPEAAFGHANIARIAAAAGDHALARTSAEKAESLDPGAYAMVDIATAYGHIGDLSAAREVFERAWREGRAALQDPFWLYRMHLAVGEVDVALDHLEKVVTSRWPIAGLHEFEYGKDHPVFDRVRNHPRFEALYREVASLGPVAEIL